MPVKEKSFRIGSGRYLQESGIINTIGDEVLRLGKKPLVVGGKTALSIAKDKIERSLKEKCEKYTVVCHTGPCSHEAAKDIAELCKNEGYDVIVGVGGGVIMDFAKLCSHYADLPIINIPTSSATCACYTPLSVCYSPEGRTIGSCHFEWEVDAVLVDPEIIITQPKRLLLAGVFDALAKFVEIKQRCNDETTDFPLGLDWAYVLSKKSFEVLCNLTEECISDMENGKVTQTFERVLFTLFATTGVISGIARGSNQTALGHKFYDSTRKMFFNEARQYLHGEIVGVGLLLQNHYNGEESNNDFLFSLMKKYNMPSNICQIGLSKDEGVKEMYFDAIKNSSAIDNPTQKEIERLSISLDYLWNVV